MTPAVSGEVTGLEVEIGETVEKGQVLFTLVNPQLDVAVAEAQNAYDKAVLAVDSAKTRPDFGADQPGQRLQLRLHRAADQAIEGERHRRGTRDHGGGERGDFGRDRA